MRLVADRFVVPSDRDSVNQSCALDLATGDAIQLTVEPTGDAAAERQWALACDARQREQHFAQPALIDFGHAGGRQRFEAWSEPLVPVAVSPRAMVLPAIALIERSENTALAELCERVDNRRPRALALWGPPGSGRRTAITAMARVARRNGIVPVDTDHYADHRALFADRTLLLIDWSGDHRGLATWLHALRRSARPHICVVVGTQEVKGIEGLALAPLTVDALVTSARLPAGQPRLLNRVTRAAEQARGLPGRFVRGLWPLPLLAPARQRVVSSSRVAEAPAVYGTESPAASAGRVVAFDGAASEAVRPWPTPSELAALRRRMTAAEALIRGGRHVPGIRALRQVVAALARRDAWGDALRAALTLAATLLRRGRPRDAERVLDDAHAYAERGVDTTALIDVAVLTGEAWIDLARLDEAERVLSGALTLARTTGDRGRLLAAATALSRCLFWRGAYTEAGSVLHVDAQDDAPATQVRRLRALARALVAQGDSSRSLALVEEARRLAAAQNDAARIAEVAQTAAEIKLAIGDLDGVDREVAVCVAAGNMGKHPMRAVRARLIRIEADRRRGTTTIAAPLAALRRLAMAGPPLVRARWELLKALVDTPGDQVIRREAARTGLKALELFGGAKPRSMGQHASRPFIEQVVGILGVCQHAEDEVAVLTDVCARVRHHLHAVAAAFVCPMARGFDVIAADGPRMEPDVGERAHDAGVVIGPHRLRERLEAAAAVQYGGRSIGALSVRWTLGVSHDLSPTEGVLLTASAASAPVVAALLARRAQPPEPSLIELIGATPPMIALRQAVERAAVAPYGVLVEGESGSGKELVARAIHRCGLRRNRTFATLNCAALPDDLVEAELFGHVRGSFTGAIADRPGVFEEAHGGTLFLDEVGELSARAQAKLLRVVQEGEFRRIGDSVARHADVRIVSATNRDLRREVEAGRFRLDLIYRLDIIRISVPPLRERRDDLPILIEHFWADATRRVASRASLAVATRAALTAYDWPGNVRELQNVLAALAVRSPRRGVVPPTALPSHIAGARMPEGTRLDAARRRFEESFVRAAMTRAGGRRARAAEELGVTRQGLTKLLTRLGIAP